MEKSVIYVSPHPDDIISVAGTLMLLKKKGYKIYDFCMSRGEKANDLPNLVEIRTNEEKSVCEIIGAQLEFFEQPDGAMYANEEICATLANRFKEINPVAVITAWALEKPDHSAVCNMTMKALALADLLWTTEFYMSEIDLQGHNFTPQIYVNITEVYDDIKRVGACYESQQEFIKPSLDLKRVVGKKAWVGAAETFMYHYPLINRRWDRPSEDGSLLRSL